MKDFKSLLFSIFIYAKLVVGFGLGIFSAIFGAAVLGSTPGEINPGDIMLGVAGGILSIIFLLISTPSIRRIALVFKVGAIFLVAIGAMIYIITDPLAYSEAPDLFTTDQVDLLNKGNAEYRKIGIWAICYSALHFVIYGALDFLNKRKNLDQK